MSNDNSGKGSFTSAYRLDDELQTSYAAEIADLDNDGDLDPVFAGEGRSNEVWWWENPYPNYDPKTPWKRYNIKKSGENKQHDQLFGDFDGDGLAELVFWNQNANSLFLADVPENPKELDEWNFKAIYTYAIDGEMQPPGSVPGWKRKNEHELGKEQQKLKKILNFFQMRNRGKLADSTLRISRE